VFFVLIKGASEGYVYERRYYCNEDEKLIQQLDREGEGGELKANNVENKTDLNKNIKVVLADDFDEIERALN
jgi:NADH:ubiquinone oxidoreductase subunit F (NADH-binding)